MSQTKQKKSLPLRLVLSGEDDSSSAMLRCPVYGCSEVHIGPVVVEQGYTVAFVECEEVRTAMTSRHKRHRGSGVGLHFHCEWGHCFGDTFEFHKGTTTLSMRTGGRMRTSVTPCGT